MSVSVIVASTTAPWVRRVADYLELTKPRLSVLVLVTTAAGFWLGARPGESTHRLWPALIGTALVVAGANAMNQWLERDLDGRMRRTQSRPLPAGRVSADAAWRFAAFVSAVGLMSLALFVNLLSAALAFIASASYLFLYTPLKRATALCTLAGAIPGALPPVIGWVAARQTIGVEAWGLFALMFCWQLPHFLAIALMYRDDYARAGFRMLPVIEHASSHATARQIVLYCAVLVPLSVLPVLLGLGGPSYFYGALTLSVGLLAIAMHTALRPSPQAARRLFLASVLYLPLLLGWLVTGARGRSSG